MSTYVKNGVRAMKLAQKKKAKFHLKEFYRILGQIDEIVKYLKETEVEITEDNVDEIVSELIGRPLDSMEKFLILGKMSSPTVTEDSIYHGNKEI
jgi:hypothetical protein